MDRSEADPMHHDLVVRLLDGDGRASTELRRAAFENTGLQDGVRPFVETVALRPAEVTDSDLASVRQAGLSDDQIWEIAVCAAVGQATRQYEAALAALHDTLADRRTS